MKRLFESTLIEVVKKVDDIDRAMSIAWDITKSDYSEPTTIKSSTFYQQGVATTDNIIQVMLGSPNIDTDNDQLEFIGKSKPFHPIVGDMEHMYLNPDEVTEAEKEMFEGFNAIADRYFHKEDGSLWADVEIPKHIYTPTFMKEWESGQLGVSVEYDYPKEAIEFEYVKGERITKVTEGILTGFSFTRKPANVETKIKNG